MAKWLDNAIFYEIYPQSFLDTNGDGIGDFQGIIEKLDYIKELGCNAIWMNPCFASPFGDAGYDVADYYQAAPRYGTNADLKRLFHEVHKRDMHILLDLVPGHTSVAHPWFKESCKADRNEFTDRYIWTDSTWGQLENMGSLCGISEREGSVIVNFFAHQPALNYGFYKKTQDWQQDPDDPGPKATLAEMENVMRFWIGMVFQNYALYPHLTVEKNIQFPLENLKGADKLSKEEMSKRVLEAAKLVQIDHLLERKPNELSGGQQQRVAIARALVKLPRVLLLDEPLSNLDARLRLQTREEIRRIQQETQITTIFVTHDQDEAMSISDMIVVMKDGIVQQIGKPQNVYDDPVNLFVAKFLGTPPINVFDGEVKSGQLYIGSEAVLPAPGVADQTVHVGIRPEGFVLKEDGPLSCDLVRLEVMGRDVSIVSTHEKSQNATIRSIIDADGGKSLPTGKVHFALKPAKVFLFCTDTEERIRF